MLLVRTKLCTSNINGIGLYAAEFIPKDTIIWKSSVGLDLKFTEAEYQRLKLHHDFGTLDKYIYKSLVSNCYILCVDDARFINHSFLPNTLDTSEDLEGFTVAARDIALNEEITSNYQDFDADFTLYKHLLH